MSRPVRAPTACLPHATAHDKRTPACRPPEFLFPRRFNCGTWRGNNFLQGLFLRETRHLSPPCMRGYPADYSPPAIPNTPVSLSNNH